MFGGLDKRSQLWFVIALSVLCAVFISLQLTYIHTLPLVMDEYVSAFHSVEVFRRTPYADYAPYKSVLGFALNGAILHAGSDHWSGLMIAKTFLVVLNTGVVLLAALLLRRHARPAAVLAAVALLVVMSTCLERSAELRVDMESAWAGFVSLLLLLRGKWIVAGVAAAIAFLISQKGVYFVLAADAALLFHWGFRVRERARLRPLLMFCAGALGTLVLYIIVWAIIAGSLGAVIDAMFFSHRRILLDNPYGNIRERFWMQTFWRNPGYYLAFVAALWRLDVLRRAHRDDQLLRVLVPYAGVVFALCLLHSKPWPYFIPMLFPTVLVVHSVFFDRAVADSPRMLTPAVIAVLVLLGLVWPLRRVDDVLDRDLGRQRATVEFAEYLHNEHGSYLGTVPYLYRTDQVISAFESLDKTQIRALRKQGAAAHAEYIAQLRERKLAFVVHSYRIRGLPGPIRRFIKTNYERLWGSVLVYAPQLSPAASHVQIWLAGRYRLSGDAPVVIDGTQLMPADYIELAEGKHTLSAPEGGRLALYPEGIDDYMDPRFESSTALFPNVYEY